jgi:hypothetical protein
VLAGGMFFYQKKRPRRGREILRVTTSKIFVTANLKSKLLPAYRRQVLFSTQFFKIKIPAMEREFLF